MQFRSLLTSTNYRLRHCCSLMIRQRLKKWNRSTFTSGPGLNKIDLKSNEWLTRLEKLHGLPIIHHHGYVCDFPPNHRFPMKKFHKVIDYLVSDRVIDRNKQVLEPDQIPMEIAANVHTHEYVDRFFHGRTSENEQRATGFVWTPGLASRVRYETGGTVLAALVSLQRGMACSTAGGTHHAFPDRGAGFCLLNDLAVAAKYLLDENLVEKILIVDLDVHQGDGTAHIFKNNENVFTFSMHSRKNFPFRKEQSDIDIALDDGVEDEEFLNVLQENLDHIVTSFRPDFVLYDAGVDPHKDDLLGKLNISDSGLMKRDLFVLSEITKKGIPIASVIGGGYSDNIDVLAKRHTILHRAATKVWMQSNRFCL